MIEVHKTVKNKRWLALPTYETVDAAMDAILTHRCRKQLNWRLNPRHCAARTSAKRKTEGGNPYGGGFAVKHVECIGCPGPITNDEAELMRSIEWERGVEIEAPAGELKKKCGGKYGCGKEFPATKEFFYRQVKGLYGLSASCKECAKAKQRKWNKENWPKTKEKRKRKRGGGVLPADGR